jgi:pseudaminic acid biosynthesis-associated methylase
LMPMAELSAVEINQNACKTLESLGFIKVYCGSMIDFEMDRTRDFVFSKGVLIHIDPKLLDHAYEALYRTSKRYICVCEYYNPTPVEVKYRGYENKLFKRDFPGEMLERYADLRLVDYGFVYHRDPCFPQDDLSWFLMEKSGMAKPE